ncbi:MAG TPA: hypothetical protein VJ745_00360 [Gaiellaceae bacterium]|nr:hypothetical protein [Gaiellaceae bacterium]
MDRKRLTWPLVAIGAALVAVSALADPLGIGEGGGVGYKQVTGIVVGGILIAGGLVLMIVARRSEASQQAEP